jgi:hypothetical protein
MPMYLRCSTLIQKLFFGNTLLLAVRAIFEFILFLERIIIKANNIYHGERRLLLLKELVVKERTKSFKVLV